MEVGTWTVKSVQHHSHGVSANSTSSASARPIMSPSRLARLPPISSAEEEGEGHQGHPSSLFLKTATSELKETMQHLLCEVRARHQKYMVIVYGMRASYNDVMILFNIVGSVG